MQSDPEISQELPSWAMLAIARARPPLRPALSALLKLDMQLSRVVLTAKEPMLAQIRLAWWREELSRPTSVSAPAPVDPLLISLRNSPLGSRAELAGFIDGWEDLLENQPWSGNVRLLFLSKHAAVFRALAEIAGKTQHGEDAALHGKAWAMAKLAHFDEVSPAPGHPILPRLPSELRALAIIGGLSRRSLLRGGKPLMGDRLSPFAALRLGIFGT